MSCIKPDNNTDGDVVCDVGNPLPASRRVSTHSSFYHVLLVCIISSLNVSSICRKTLTITNYFFHIAKCF